MIHTMKRAPYATDAQIKEVLEMAIRLRDLKPRCFVVEEFLKAHGLKVRQKRVREIAIANGFIKASGGTGPSGNFLWATGESALDERWRVLHRRPPSKPGIYAIYEGPSLIYIGESGSLASRLTGSHHVIRTVMPVARLTIKARLAPEQTRARREEESRLIFRLRPRMNFA